jgi:hypothetical protein
MVVSFRHRFSHWTQGLFQANYTYGSQRCFGDGGRKLHTTNRTIGFSQAHIGQESNRIGLDRFTGRT